MHILPALFIYCNVTIYMKIKEAALLEDRQSYGEYNGKHSLRIDDRRIAIITGVKDVISFDAHELVLETIQGTMTIKGDQLHVSRLTLDKGEVDVDGRVDNVLYSDSSAKKNSESLIGRLFR